MTTRSGYRAFIARFRGGHVITFNWLTTMVVGLLVTTTVLSATAYRDSRTLRDQNTLINILIACRTQPDTCQVPTPSPSPRRTP